MHRRGRPSYSHGGPYNLLNMDETAKSQNIELVSGTIKLPQQQIKVEAY